MATVQGAEQQAVQETTQRMSPVFKSGSLLTSEEHSTSSKDHSEKEVKSPGDRLIAAQDMVIIKKKRSCNSVATCKEKTDDKNAVQYRGRCSLDHEC